MNKLQSNPIACLKKYLQVGAIAAAFAMPMDADAHMDHQDPTEIKTEAQSRPSDKLVSTGNVAQDIQNLKDKYAAKLAKMPPLVAKGLVKNHVSSELLGMVVNASVEYRTDPALQAYVDELRATYGTVEFVEDVQELITSANSVHQSRVELAESTKKYDAAVRVSNYFRVK